MEIEKRGQDYYIKLGKNETPRNTLRAVAVASFELSRGVGMGFHQFDGGSTLRPENADQFIEERDGKLNLYMDYVEGRQVKTSVDTEDKNTLRFDGWLYERDRGNPAPMFKRSQEILDNIDTAAALPTEITSTKDQFKSGSLDSRLKELGYARNSGETDEKFRTRVFPVLFPRDPILAGEFLFGKHITEWRDEEKEVYAELLNNKPPLEKLVEFAKVVSIRYENE